MDSKFESIQQIEKELASDLVSEFVDLIDNLKASPPTNLEELRPFYEKIGNFNQRTFKIVTTMEVLREELGYSKTES